MELKRGGGEKGLLRNISITKTGLLAQPSATVGYAGLG
jgi:hypothetical protein